MLLTAPKIAKQLLTYCCQEHTAKLSSSCGYTQHFTNHTILEIQQHDSFL